MKSLKENNNFKRNILKLGVFLLAIFAFGLSFLTLNTKKVNADGEITTISSLSEITDMSGKYELNKGQTYTYSASLGVFSGYLNGNGANIVFEGTACVPLFNGLGANAEVKNLTFSSNDQTKLVYTFDVTSGTSYGLLASTITNANVYGIEFNNIDLIIYDNNSNTSVPTLNIGFVAGQVKNSKVHQIKIENCNILPFQTEGETATVIGVRPCLNLGLIAGYIANGSFIQNNLIINNNVKIVLTESQSQNFNLGGLVGLIDSGFVTNNIISTSVDYTCEVEFDRTVKYLNFGYVAGKCNTNMFSIINNVINIKYAPLLSLDDENAYVGILLGYMPSVVETDSITGVLTTLDAQYIGNMANQTFTYKYKNLKYLTEETLINTNITKNNDLWNVPYAWDFDKIWRETNSNIPTLQIFEEYAVSFSSSESVKSLGIENLPTLQDNADVVISNLVADNISYGSTLTITTNITNESNFDKFFYIVGLRLNGNVIYSMETNKSEDGFSVTSSTNDTGDVVFEVKNINANNAGVYSVQLARKTYKIKLKVYALTVNEQQLVPGKVKNNMASVSNNEIVVDMKYGEKFTYETYEVNSDYAKDADWYLTYISQDQETNPDEEDYSLFNLEKELAKTDESEKLACVESSRTLSWTFSEKSVLFGYGKTEEDARQYLDINNYNYNDDDSSSKMFIAYVVFTRDVKDIEIRFKFDNDEEITEKIADVIIDDGAITVTYKNGMYVAKIRYGTKPHTITLRQVSTDYSFDGWYLNSRLAGTADDEYAGTFEIQNDGDTNTVVLNAVFTKASNNKGANLLWLWITLGGVALVAVVVIIIIVKKKNSGNSGYKKYMY